MKGKDFIFIRDFNLRSSFDLLHLQSIECFESKAKRLRPCIRNSEFNIGFANQLLHWEYSSRSKKRAFGSQLRRCWKRKPGVMRKYFKLNPSAGQMTLSQIRADVVSTGEYFDFFLTRNYRDRQKRKRWDSDIALDEFFSFFEQYDVVSKLPSPLFNLSSSINFAAIPSFWPASFIHITLQNARYPFWAYGGDYSPFIPFGGFAQITNHYMEPEALEFDYWFGSRSKCTPSFTDVETQLSFFVVALCWGFLFDFRGPRMLEAQFAVGFLSAKLLSATLRANQPLDRSYVSEDWAGEDSEDSRDSAPVTSWRIISIVPFLYSISEFKNMWDVFLVGFWRLSPLNYSVPYKKLFLNDLSYTVKSMRTKFLLSSGLFKRITSFPLFSQFTETEARFFSYNNYARPSLVFLRLIPKVVFYLSLSISFYARNLWLSIRRIFTINGSIKIFNYILKNNYAYNFIDSWRGVCNPFISLKLIFYFRAFLIFSSEMISFSCSIGRSFLSKSGVIINNVAFILSSVLFISSLFVFLNLLFFLLFFLLAIFLLVVFARFESNIVRADKFAFFERSFRMLNVVYLYILRSNFFFLMKTVFFFFITMLSYLTAFIVSLISLISFSSVKAFWRYLPLFLNIFPFSSYPFSFSALGFVAEVGAFEYLCFWLRCSFLKVYPRFTLHHLLNFLSLSELNWLIINSLHLLRGAVGWWITIKPTGSALQKWRELFEFNTIVNSSGALNGSFFVAFALRGKGFLKAFSVLLIELLFFRLALPFPNISGVIKSKFLALDLQGFSVVLNDLLVNSLFLNTWGSFLRAHLVLNDLLLVSNFYLFSGSSMYRALNFILFVSFKSPLLFCVRITSKFLTLFRRILLLLLCTLIYITLIIFMVYFVILTATLLYVCGIKAGLSIFLYISLKIIVICFILSVMREKG